METEQLTLDDMRSLSQGLSELNQRLDKLDKGQQWMEELQDLFQKLQADIEEGIRGGREETMTMCKKLMKGAKIHLIEQQEEKR